MASASDQARWLAGVACICLVSVIWTFATVLKQIVFNDLNYNEPLVFTYVCNVCYALHLPLHALGRCLGLTRPVPWRSRRDTSVAAEMGARAAASGEARAAGLGAAKACPRAPENAEAGAAADADASASQSSQSARSAEGSSAREAAIAALLIAPIWFMSQWTYSSGVAMTSVTSSTVISATSVVWTLIASVLFTGERLTLLKGCGVLACMAGNIVTQLGDMHGGKGGQAMGDLLCLASAVGYAAYTTILKKLVREDTSVALMFGFLGAAIAVAGAPIVLTFGYSALQKMSLKIFGLLVFNGIFDNVISQYLWAKAVQWTSPTAATVGLSLTIPLSIAADFLRRHPPSVWSFLAGALVVAGFVSVTLATRPAAQQEACPQPSEADPRSPLSSPLSPAHVAETGEAGAH